MALIDDFKTATGATEGDQYIIDYYLEPALNIAAANSSVKKKRTKVVINNSTLTYDLTDSNIADPAVGSEGIQEIAYDDYFDLGGFVYKTDLFLEDPTTLRIITDANITSTRLEFNYFGYFTTPVSGGSDTDLPSKLKPAVLKLAKVMYQKDGALTGGGNGSGVNGNSNVVEVREANLTKKFSGNTNALETRNMLQIAEMEAIEEIQKLGGWSTRNNLYAYQIF